jgi:hypothetical protein
MKKSVNNTEAYTHPNAASRQYRINKAIDTALTAAATVGLTVLLMFLMII